MSTRKCHRIPTAKDVPFLDVFEELPEAIDKAKLIFSDVDEDAFRGRAKGKYYRRQYIIRSRDRKYVVGMLEPSCRSTVAIVYRSGHVRPLLNATLRERTEVQDYVRRHPRKRHARHRRHR